MLKSARRGGFQQARVKSEIEEGRHAERSEERGRRRGGQIETGIKLKMSLARPREKCMMQMCVEGWKSDQT